MISQAGLEMILDDLMKNNILKSLDVGVLEGSIRNETIKGKLADSTFEIVNELAIRIKKDSTIQKKEIFCYDCPKMAIRINSNNHSYDLHQLGKIDTIFNELINQLEQIDGIKEGTILDTVIDFKTKYWTNPPPPPIPLVKFQKPKNK